MPLSVCALLLSAELGRTRWWRCDSCEVQVQEAPLLLRAVLWSA